MEIDKITVYTPDRVLKHPLSLLRVMFTDLYVGRELAWRLMVRNLSAMYRQTILGFAWAFLPPIFAAVTFIALKSGGVMEISETKVPYVVWVLTGTFLWQVFTDALNMPMRQVSQAKPMLAKINFPREALIMAGIGETLFNFCIRLFILVPVLIYYQTVPHIYSLIIFPIALLTLICLGTMFGILLTPISILYQDIEKGIPMLLPFLMIFSGAVVPIPESSWGKWIRLLNPIYPVLETARDAFLGQNTPLLVYSILIGLCALILGFCGWILYRISMPHLIARMGG